MNTNSIAAFIPVYYPAPEFLQTLEQLTDHSLLRNILVIDSTPDLDMSEQFLETGVDVVRISPNDFSHGSTREQFRKYFNNEFALWMTQDVLLNDDLWLEDMAEPVLKGRAAVATIRQVPHHDADFFAIFDRAYLYPKESFIQTRENSRNEITVYASNSCALWSNAALDAIGGFPDVNHLEDMIASGMLLNSGRAIAYIASSTVLHSHNLSLCQTFKRYRMTGCAIKSHGDALGFHSSRGSSYCICLLKAVLRKNFLLLPRALFLIIAKALGFYFGKIL